MSSAVEMIARELRQVPRRYIENVPLADLEEFPGNPKDHDMGAILESMQKNGVVDPVFVQDWPETPLYILAGHGRKKALLSAGITHVDCLFFKISPAAARRYVLASNRAQERGGWNEDLLVKYLTAQVEAGELGGTGFDPDDVEERYRMVMGQQFQPHPDVSGNEDAKFKANGEGIRVVVGNAEATLLARDAIIELLADNPDWDARVQ